MEFINDKNFEEKTKNGVVLVDFFANWCGPCRMLSPILEDIAEEMGRKVSIFKVDVDENEKLSRNFGIMSIPTIILFVDGVQKEKHIGLMQYDELVELISKYI